jgi:hypothetical protein
VCDLHRGSVTRFCGVLWHAASAQDLVQCPLGCWVTAADLRDHTRTCPRVHRGPIHVPGFGGVFASWNAVGACLAANAQRRFFFALETGPSAVIRVAFGGEGRVPVDISLIIPSPTACYWVCVKWRASGVGADDAAVRQYALITPCMQTHDKRTLLPVHTCHAPAAAPARVESVRAVRIAHIGAGCMLFGSSWMLWAAIIASPCARRRYVYLREACLMEQRGALARTAADGDAADTTVVTLDVQTHGPYPPLLPAYKGVACGFRCQHCGGVHASLGAYLARCAPDGKGDV